MGPIVDAFTRALTERKRPLLMGVVNVTPDSFYDGGRFLTSTDARQQLDVLVADGAEVVDLGAESTRPGAKPVPPDEQIRRLHPVVEHAVQRGDVVVSVDTANPEVAEHVLAQGAHVLNDASCLRQPELAKVVARHEALLVLMHAREPMDQMKGFSEYPMDAYSDVVADVQREWTAARDRAEALGVERSRIYFDPGIGFNKNAFHSLEILARLREFQVDKAPIVIGPSRKSFIAQVDGAPADRRLGGTVAACVLAVERGASILRVHDVHAVRQALGVYEAVHNAPAPREASLA